VLEDSDNIKDTQDKIMGRYEDWIAFLSERKKIKPLVGNRAVQSHTVVPVTGDAETLQHIKTMAKKNDILLGEGYGEWKATTFRIANFPALKKKEIKKLMTILKKF